uniref:Clusterin-associated protein 1 n=1 Tax=Panagrellus redivivus TaxID=6233 RepID=A0A7E4V0T6_PANRE
MSEVLEWIVKKFDANARIPKKRDTEADRILFVKTCVLILMQKARIKLNPRNLYMSDGHAVREMMSVLKLLYSTTKGAPSKEVENSQLAVLRNQINTKKIDIREASAIAGEIPASGAAIYDLLSKELFAKETRMRALSQQLNVAEVEKLVRQMIEKGIREENEISTKLANIGQDEHNLDAKIERRRLECDQLQKRLSKLQAYRPPNRDEFERYEAQLKVLYEEYVVVFRNLGFMKQRLNEVEIVEAEKSMEAEKNMREIVEQRRAENQLPPVELKEDDEDDKTQQRRQVFGSMLGAGVDDSDLEDDDDDYDDVLDMPSEHGIDDLELSNSGLPPTMILPPDDLENLNPEEGQMEQDEALDKTENHSDDNF